jgi:hypothetical protein
MSTIGPDEVAQGLKHWRDFTDYLIIRDLDAFAEAVASGRLSYEEGHRLATGPRDENDKAWEAMRDGVGLSPEAHGAFVAGARELLRQIGIEGGEKLSANELLMIAFMGLAVGLKARQLADEKG